MIRRCMKLLSALPVVFERAFDEKTGEGIDVCNLMALRINLNVDSTIYRALVVMINEMPEGIARIDGFLIVWQRWPMFKEMIQLNVYEYKRSIDTYV